jgi:hypothetical protein
MKSRATGWRVVPPEKVCYYTVTKDETGADCVRFGLCRRAEAQIIATCERWLRLSERLADEGYRLIEVQDKKGDTKGRGRTEQGG